MNLLLFGLFVAIAAKSVSSVPPEVSIDRERLIPFSEPDAKWKIPDRYIVGLNDGYALEAHWAAIGMDLSQVGRDFTFLKGINAYAVTITNGTIVHSGVRSDYLNVRYVESILP